MKVKKLFQDIASITFKGSKEKEITGLSCNSKCVAPGNLFIVKKGQSHDAHHFIPDAIAAGAVALLTDIYDPFLKDVVQIIHPDVASIEALIAARYYQFASHSLFLVGVTGTNGKSTCSYLIKHLLDHLQAPCGLIGTIEWIIGKNYFPSTQTTPDILTNHKLFYEMTMQGCKAAVMEVSSHALDQGRVQGLEFDVAVFTNLTQDHLDYHKTMQQYLEAKAKLFSMLASEPASCKKSLPKVAVVNADSFAASTIVQNCKAHILTYAVDAAADLRATDLVLKADGMHCRIHYKGKTLPFGCQLIGRFNIYNCLAAIAVGLAYGVSLEEILPILASFKKVPGRLERVSNRLGIHIFVDYAHTDDALKNVLETLNEIKKGRVITVFGCGGNRDQTKRPKMGKVAEALSDQTIVTSDNPRQEDPETIIRDILQGFERPGSAIVEVDRRAAIKRAIQLAKKEDIVLIAGKGHEATQSFSHQTIAFDDRIVAHEIVDSNRIEKI